MPLLSAGPAPLSQALATPQGRFRRTLLRCAGPPSLHAHSKKSLGLAGDSGVAALRQWRGRSAHQGKHSRPWR
eukprot:1639244-Alexandrium_andersonii.AAC.1